MIPMNRNDNQICYVGEGRVENYPLPVYSDVVCDFLNDLSMILRGDKRTKTYPDILTFAFWCRKGNVQKLKKEFLEKQKARSQEVYRMGRGLVFHVAPSNVPVNFAFSLAFGLLSGCGNIVRVSEKNFPQTEIICDGINQVLQNDKYDVLHRQNQVISYGHNQQINDMYSGICDARILWGGDSTIQTFRQSPVSSRCVEIAFADRYSFAIMDETKILRETETKFQQLAQKFYNDTYLMDQNACSSPHLIAWMNPDGNEQGRKRFWEQLHKLTEKYDLPEKKAMDKYTMLCERAAGEKACRRLSSYENLLYVVSLSEIPENLENLRGIFGCFYEVDVPELAQLLSKVSTKVQTCLYYGIEPQEIMKYITQNHISGIDRIVPVGKAMDINVYWDGYDIIDMLSREIVLER